MRFWDLSSIRSRCYQLGFYHFGSYGRNDRWRYLAGYCRYLLPDGGSAHFAFPIGVMSGIYMNECAEGEFGTFIRVMTNGRYSFHRIPDCSVWRCLSIIWGLVIVFCRLFDIRFALRTALSGQRRKLCESIPDSMREGSRALGATKLQVIWHVIFCRWACQNIITGLILALGRVSGETAPILFTCAAYFLRNFYRHFGSGVCLIICM